MTYQRHHDYIWKSAQRERRGASITRISLLFLLLICLLQPGCLFRKKKIDDSKYPPAPLRSVALPMNIPPENPDLRWSSLAAASLMIQLTAEATDLEPVPMWEAMPVVLESVGPTRNISAENAAYLASRLAARWAILASVLPGERENVLRIDFLPARTSQVAYRYEGRFGADRLESELREAFGQFLNYLIARPLPGKSGGGLGGMQEIGRALDLEYGWFAKADPGQAAKIVSQLAVANKRLAELLFNPSLYPGILAPAKANPPEHAAMSK